MAMKIYLEGGGRHSEKVFESLEGEILSSTDNKIIFILDFAREDDIIMEKKEKDIDYFKELGAEKINFASDCSSFEEIKEKMDESGVLYLAGGNTELLLEKIKEKNITSLIKSYNRIIIGNSAGAYACCKEYIKIRDNVKSISSSLGLVNFCCITHYKPEFDEPLKEYSNDRDIYAIPEPSVIVVEDGKLNFIGNIYLFSKENKTKVN